MGSSSFTFTNSKILKLEEEVESSFLCHDLEEKRRYLYFRRGPFGDPGSPCGSERNKIPKDLVSWEQTGELCTNGSPIWKIKQV